MRTDSILQGRLLSAPDLVEIRILLGEHPSWHRTRLSRELCHRWGWRNEAGHILSLITRCLSQDWLAQYGHPIHLVETFVERERFLGTCYRAAGWILLGRTTGPGRNPPGAEPQGPRKEVLLQPLSGDFRRQLGA